MKNKSSGNIKGAKSLNFEILLKCKQISIFSQLPVFRRVKIWVQNLQTYQIFAILRLKFSKLLEKVKYWQFWDSTNFPNVHPSSHCAQWAKWPISGTFVKNWRKNRDGDRFFHLLEAYYDAGHEKMTKSEISPTSGGWGQIIEFSKIVSYALPKAPKIKNNHIQDLQS